MRIRQAIVGDADACLRMDSSYRTNYVWHLVEQVTDKRIEVTLERTRLPRAVDVTYPCGLADLAAECRSGDCFLVADELTRVWGCIIARERRWTSTAWVEYCVVDAPHRGQGIGTNLLQAAEAWASEARLRQLILPLQTKNDLAITSCLAHGYRYAGYLDRYFTNDDVGLLFIKTF